MLRWWLSPIAACVLAVGSVPASADSSVSGNVTQLGTRSTSARLRLNAALALSNTKSKDPRAVIALARALTQDSDERVRRVAALGLEKMIDASTADDAKQLAFAALDEASSIDKDATVREIATRAARSFASLRKKKSTARPGPRNGKPEVFVNIDRTNDQSKKLPSDAGERVTKIVKKSVESTGYATTWPTGSLPTSAELNSSRSRAFIVASTVKKIEITKNGGQTTVACTVAMRIAPWTGRDGGERWEANRAAQASGSAKAVTGNRDRDVQGGVRDCIEAVAEDVTSRQVVPFLKRVAQM